MSAIPLRDSFIDVHLGEEEIEQHVLDVIKARPTGPERRAAIAYLRQIVASDARDIDHYRYINARARQVLEAREKLHHFDIRSEKHTDLFVTAVGVNYTALLAVANAEVIADGQTLNQNLSVTGENASFHGIGTGSAVAGTLECGCIVNGRCIIDADGVLIEGVEFRAQVGDLKTVSFAGASQDIVFRNCRFDGSLFTDDDNPFQGSVFWYGPNFSGSVVLENCEIKNYTSWMLADLTTTSATPTVALSTVVVKDCLFTDCKGSFAIRGLAASPTRSVTITGNKWAYTAALSATSMHPSFWNCFEANNAKDVVVRHNEAEATRLGGNAVRGFFQTWSKADSHYVLQFEKNTLSGFDYAVQIAANPSFYSPDQLDTRMLIKSETGKLTDIRFGLSLFYPWATGAWAPIDNSRFPTAPVTDFADGLLNQT